MVRAQFLKATSALTFSYILMNIIRFLPKYPDFGVNARQSIFYILFLWKKEKKRKKTA